MTLLTTPLRKLSAIALLCLLLPAPSDRMLSLAAAQSRAGEDPPAMVQARRRMVETQFSGFGRTTITDRVVLDAMLKVPRHLFVPASSPSSAYADTPLPIGHGQTISQPYIVALMTQALELKSGMKVLEIGTGSGYQAAILGEITPFVYTMEIIEPLYQSAEKRLRDLGYSSVTVRLGDGYYGLWEFAPFDRIIVTCAALHVPPPLFEQLASGGRIVIPVGAAFDTQRLLVVTKDRTGGRTSETVELVRFVPLIGGPTGR